MKKKGRRRLKLNFLSAEQDAAGLDPLFGGVLDDADNMDNLVQGLQNAVGEIVSGIFVDPFGDFGVKDNRATLNRMPFAAHTLQQCIRAALEVPAVTEAVGLIR